MFQTHDAERTDTRRHGRLRRRDESRANHERDDTQRYGQSGRLPEMMSEDAKFPLGY